MMINKQTLVRFLLLPTVVIFWLMALDGCTFTYSPTPEILPTIIPPSASTPTPAPSFTATIQLATKTATLQPTQIPTPTKAEEIGPNAVWGSWKRAIQEMEDCLVTDLEATRKCVVSIMEKYNASPGAIAFYEKYGHGGVLADFKELGRVDLGTIFYPFAANDNFLPVLLNGDPSLVPVYDIGNVDITHDPLYPVLSRRYPQLTIWPTEIYLVTPQSLPDGSQRFIISYLLVNGGHASPAEGYALFAFDFDAQGKFIGNHFLQLSYNAEPPPSSVSTIPTQALSRTNGLSTTCINSNVWTPYKTQGILKDSAGCWLLEHWGISATDTGLTLTEYQVPYDVMRGIYSRIPGNATITLDLRLDQISMGSFALSGGLNGESGLVIGIGTPEKWLFSGSFLIFRANSSSSGTIFTSKTLSATGTRFQDFSFGSDQVIVVKKSGNTVAFQVNNLVVGNGPPLSMVNASNSVFWIGYALPRAGRISASITNIQFSPVQ
jgi:hypothetical protein